MALTKELLYTTHNRGLLCSECKTRLSLDAALLWKHVHA